MKKFIILLLMLSGTGFAQDCLRDLGGGACIVQENDKYGIKKKGKYIIPTYFDQISDHSGKYFSVEQNGKWGIFNIKGQIVLPVAFDQVTAVNAEAGLIAAVGNGYNGLVITDGVAFPKFGQKGNPFLLIGENEVSVGEYLTFLQDLENNPPDDFTYEMGLPDSSKMAANTRKVYSRFMKYAQSEDYSDYNVLDAKLKKPLHLPGDFAKDKSMFKWLELPINGISYKQAQRYCVWFSEVLNAHHTPEAAYEMVVRLPKPMEWEEIALGGLPETMKNHQCIDSVNTKSCILFNYHYNKQVCTHIEEQVKLYGDNVVPAYSYNPDFHGVYNIFGNVSEMTNIERVAKGGNYTTYATKCNTNSQQKYDGPAPWLGFRWVIEYRMKK